jgi:DNA-binding XRE family transcriptional regulator
MATKRANIRRAKRVVKELELDKKTEEIVLRSLDLMPMIEVLAKVPGETITEKAENCGVTRQMWYLWLRGENRPSLTQATAISEMTGIPVERITQW